MLFSEFSMYFLEMAVGCTISSLNLQQFVCINNKHSYFVASSSEYQPALSMVEVLVLLPLRFQALYFRFVGAFLDFCLALWWIRLQVWKVLTALGLQMF